MYRCFKLSMDLWEFSNNNEQFVDECRKHGKKLKEDLVTTFDSM